MPDSSTTEPAPIANRVFVLVLQHPQEQDRELGTARLLVERLAAAQLVVGLSWPNLTKVLGRNADPKRWAVLYLGSAQIEVGEVLTAVGRDGRKLTDQATALQGIEGLVLLDGSWSQAKALWWRNAWLLRLRRLVINPARPSRYGRLRREPRPDSVSTLEAAATALAALERRPEIETLLGADFDSLLRNYRAAKQQPAAVTAPADPPPSSRAD